MRSLASIAALATLALAGTVCAQSLTEHAAAAAGATIGTAAGRPVAKALSGIFDNVDEATATAAKTGNKAKAVKPTIPPDTRNQTDKDASTNRGAGPGSFSPGFGVSGGETAASEDYSAPRSQSSGSRRRSAPAPAAFTPVVPPPVVAEPVKEPSLAEVASVKIGTTEKDLFSTLGKPESNVIVPGDDGHLRESCQYWAGGKQLGTIRLDNGQVVKVEVRAEN